jgi:hypothetical protein
MIVKKSPHTYGNKCICQFPIAHSLLLVTKLCKFLARQRNVPYSYFERLVKQGV